MRRPISLTLLIALTLCILGLGLPGAVEAEHGVVRCGGYGQKACTAYTSPFVQNVIRQYGEVTWCLDARAASYPRFRAQTQRVTAQFATDLGVTAREVPYPSNPASTACIIRNSMPEVHGCGGKCAAWIYSQAFPVVIEYDWRVGYSDFSSTIGHEYGHGWCLLDEHYYKPQGVSFILTYGYWQHGAPSVMDIGTPYLPAYGPTGIWWLTEYDSERCAETIGRPVGLPPCGVGEPNAHGLRWNSCSGRWLSPEGNRYDPTTGVWELPDGTPEWGGCAPWSGRWSYYNQVWMHVGHGFYAPERGWWSVAPPC